MGDLFKYLDLSKYLAFLVSTVLSVFSIFTVSSWKKHDTGIFKQVKDQGPLHYMLRVESVSSVRTYLAECKDNSITSSEFSAGGYQWVLKIDWNEKKGDKGNGHLSMYLRLVETLKPGEDVVAMFRFYVYNQKLDNYYTVQDATGKHFSPVKPEWGISRVLPLSVLMDPSNGYVLDDCCVFGVATFPSRSACKVGTLGVVKKDASCQYTWKIENFSSLQEYKLDSPIFTIDGISWILDIYPKGDERAEGESISIFLKPKDHDDRCISEDKVFAKYDFRIKDQLGNKDHRMFNNKGSWFDANTSGWGYIEFLPLKSLNDGSKGYLKNDELIIEVSITDILRLKSI